MRPRTGRRSCRVYTIYYYTYSDCAYSFKLFVYSKRNYIAPFSKHLIKKKKNSLVNNILEKVFINTSKKLKTFRTLIITIIIESKIHPSIIDYFLLFFF